MATPLGLGSGKRTRGIPPAWRTGLVVLFGVVISVLVVSMLLKRKAEPEVAQAVAIIERPAESLIRPVEAATDAPARESSARIERQSAAGGGLIIKVPDSASVPDASSDFDARVAERTPQGILPVVGAGGHKAREIYARPFAATAKPMIAIVMTGVGISARGTESAIRALPGEVTLAFAPYGRDLPTQVSSARAAGHEILLQVPMEPGDYPASDPGPHTLRAGKAQDGNGERLRWLMSRFPGYVGLTNFMGSRLMHDPAALSPLIEEINRRGLLFLDDGSVSGGQTPALAQKAGLPVATADRVADTGGRESVDALLEDAVRIAKAGGKATVTVPALPANITRVAAFARSAASRGVALAPISAIIARNAP